MKKTIIAASVSLCLPIMSQADTLGVWVGANGWQQNYDGEVQSGQSNIDIEDELGLDDETNYNYYFALEHPIPIIPNILIQHTELDISASNMLTRNIDFEGITYPIGTTIKTNSDLTHTDATLYYEVLDNWVSLDLGLTARAFEEGVAISEPTAGESELDIDDVIPLLYVAIKFELPLTGLYIRGDANGISYDDDTLIDYKLSIGYETGLGLGLELGYRSFDLDYEDDDNETADVTVDGGYAGIFFHF